MAAWTDLITAPFNILGSLYGQPVNDITNPISASSVADREYNAMREDTQYRRLRQDLSAAGLNGWLAVNGSASPTSQPISQTSEASSRAGELGFKYRELLTEAMKFTEKQMQSAAQGAADNATKLISTIGGALLRGLF